jgi:hypothetical protein
MDGGTHMQVRGKVRIEPADGEPEEIALAVVQSPSGGLSGVPQRPASMGGRVLTLQRMSVEQRAVQVRIDDSGASETLVVHASIKPGMNFVWGGTIVMALGCAIAVIRRTVEGRARASAPESTEQRAAA